MLDDRFWTKVKKGSPLECWEWQANKNNKGYGMFSLGSLLGKKLAHRLSYADAKGPIPPGTVIRHTCDNPACVNPEHLVAGTQKQNMEDAAWRERLANTRLTTEQVISLLKDYVAGVPRKELCRRYGIKERSLSSYTDGKAWTHLHGKNGCPTLDELRAAKRLTNVTEQDARAVWKLHFDGLSVSEISSRTGLSRHSVDGLVFGKTWRHLPDAPSLEALKAGGVQRGHNQFSNGGDTRSLHPRTKIPSSEIPTISRRIAAGETLEAIGASYGVKRTAIWRIKRQYS